MDDADKKTCTTVQRIKLRVANAASPTVRSLGGVSHIGRRRGRRV